MKILNKTINISLVFVFVFLFVPQFESQRGDELTPYQEYLIELKEYRRNCRNALKPFRYDGSLTTHYSYKEYTYAKEIEIATIQKEEYRLSFNAMGVKNDGITIRIYDKAKRFNSRVLLYEKENVANTESSAMAAVNDELCRLKLIFGVVGTISSIYIITKFFK